MIVNSAQELAKGLKDRVFPHLTPRPWNLYAPADTFWWLVPSADWPAYRYGKLAISNATDVPRRDLLGVNDRELSVDQIFVGFNVEKGYGPVATVVNSSLRRKPAQIIDPQWLWFELTGEAGALRFTRTLDAVAVHADIFVYVVAGYVHDREAARGAQHDAIMFSWRAGGLTRIMDNGCPIGALPGARAVDTFVALTTALRPIDDYHWVDLYVGTHVKKGDIDLTQLYNNVLSHFDAWLR